MVFPRLVAAQQPSAPSSEIFASGNGQLDRLLGGGLHAGTGTLFMGPAGSGKSTIASMYAAHAADRARALEAGFDVHLLKPVDPAKLRELIAG